MEKDLKYKISLEDLFSRGITNADHHARHFEGSINAVAGQISKLREEIGLAVFAFSGFEVLKESAQDFIKMDKAAAELKFTVGKRGGVASDIDDLNESAEKLGKSSFFNPREIKEAANQMLNYGISVKNTKGSLEALTDVGVAKGKGLNEVISAVGMAAAGGRAMALKEYGLGFLKLEKDMSVAGAEARNFNKIIGAMKKEFSGATGEMSGNEFFKLKKIQDEFEEFRETIGKYLLRGFDMLLPYIQKGIEYLKEFGHWIIEHKDGLKTFGAILIGVAGAVALYNTGIFLANTLSKAFFLIDMIKYIASTQGLTFAQSALAIATEELNTAFAVSPLGLMVVGVGLLAGAYYELTKNTESAFKAQQEFDRVNEQKFEKEWIKEERKRVDELSEGKSAKERLKIIQEEIDLAKNAEKELNTNLLSGRQKHDKYETIISELQRMKKEKASKGEKGEDNLGSGLSEPKASKIQNITINLNQPFNNQKITMGGGSMNPKDIAQGFVEMLLSVATDAAVVAAE